MKILLVGALSWNPERMRVLRDRGHQLWGLWSRSMAWDQGPYPALEGCVRPVSLEEASRTIRDESIECVYSLFQAYHPNLWADAADGVEHGVWTLLRSLLVERHRGGFDAPIVRHWGFDVHEIDLEVSRALDGHIVCNPEKLAWWTEPVERGGCGLDVVGESEVVAFIDGDRPMREFMNDRFAEPLSNIDGEIHTVCVGRPFHLDYVALARRGIHVHVYGNDTDDPYRMIARDLRPGDARSHASLLGRYLHLPRPLQPDGETWEAVRRAKAKWVEEFSRYDAGWSYVGNPWDWAPLDDRAAIANRTGTYLLAGLPIVTDRRPGHHRYEEPRRLGVAIELVDSDHDRLRADLETEIRTREKASAARAARFDYSFDAAVDPLIRVLEEARTRYFERPREERTRFGSDPHPRLTRLAEPRLRPWVGERIRIRRLERALGPRIRRE